jgi:hypothetical protein
MSASVRFLPAIARWKIARAGETPRGLINPRKKRVELGSVSSEQARRR